MCGPGLNIYRDDGRQLRTASYTPTESGIYYLQVTRIRDDQPVRRSSFGWSLSMSDNGEPGGEGFMAVYAQGANKEGLRNAFPYYELSVEVRGPTLTSIDISGDSYIEDYEETHDGNHFGFLPGRFEYRVGLGPTETVTLAATAANTDATVAITPADADASTGGHQVNTPAGVFTGCHDHGHQGRPTPRPTPSNSAGHDGAGFRPGSAERPRRARPYWVLRESAQRPDRGCQGDE